MLGELPHRPIPIGGLQRDRRSGLLDLHADRQLPLGHLHDVDRSDLQPLRQRLLPEQPRLHRVFGRLSRRPISDGGLQRDRRSHLRRVRLDYQLRHGNVHDRPRPDVHRVQQRLLLEPQRLRLLFGRVSRGTAFALGLHCDCGPHLYVVQQHRQLLGRDVHDRQRRDLHGLRAGLLSERQRVRRVLGRLPRRRI